MTAFKQVQNYLNEKDFAILLKDCWISEEFPCRNPDLSMEEIADLFAKANKSYFMNDRDRKYFNNLPDNVTIYRGTYKRESMKKLSWTLDFETAEWFANRFETGEPIVFKTTIPKNQILAYINDRNEQEVIVHPKTLEVLYIEELELKTSPHI